MDLSLLAHTTFAQSIPTLAMSWNPVLTNILVGVFLIVSIAMILLVLIQRPQGGGLSGAFGAGGGGGGAGQTAFGTKTGDVLTGATITIFVLFLVTAIVLNFATRPAEPGSNIQTISTPAEDADPNAAETIEDAQIEDAEQAVEDVMSSEPSIETDGEASDDAPAESGTPTTGDEPVSEDPATGDN